MMLNLYHCNVCGHDYERYEQEKCYCPMCDNDSPELFGAYDDESV